MTMAITTITTIIIPMLMTTNRAAFDGCGDADGAEAAALYRLLTWLSPSFPVGAFSYSSGIEWAVEVRDIVDAPSLQDWLSCMLTDGPGSFSDRVVRIGKPSENATDRVSFSTMTARFFESTPATCCADGTRRPRQRAEVLLHAFEELVGE